jgi:dipeptidyl aminopeptidase/acylaminoacyl peptidase
MRQVLCAVLLFVCSTPALAQRVDLTTAGKIVRVADPQIAPDGRSVLILVSRANFDENRYDASIVRVDPSTREQRVLVSGRRGVTSPRWSADGSQIAFLAQVDGRTQVFAMKVDGGEAWQVTKSPTPVQNFAWRPDGRSIAYSAVDEEPKRDGDERFNRSFEVSRSSYLTTDVPRPLHLWLAPVDGAPAKRLTSGTWTLPAAFPPGPPPPPPSWSPDGKTLAFVRINSVHSGERGESTIQLLDVDTGTLRPLTSRPRGEQHPVFSPDGTRMAYWFQRPGEGNAIWVMPVTGGGFGTIATMPIERHILRGMWMPDGKSMLVAANDRTSTGLWLQTLDGEARRIEMGRVVAAANYGLDASVSRDGKIALVASEPLRPSELYLMASATTTPQRITDFNAHIAAMELGKTETIEWDGPDGFRQDGVVTYPPGFDGARKYPLVLYIHGGPRSTSKEAFSPRAQLLAAQGWIVFEPNYRGSDNRGGKFMNAIQNDAGDGPGRDVMSGVAQLKARGIVDETRIAASGWSYGGYMTTWLIGNYPETFRAAVAGAPVTDRIDQYVLSDGNGGRPGATSPFVNPKQMETTLAQSPLTYAAKVKAPTLIMALTGDYRVPITQAYSYYHALRDNGVTVQFVGYPLPGHSPTDPVHQRDVDRRWVEWIKKHFDAASKPGTEQQK